MRRNVDIFQCSYGYGDLHFPVVSFLEIPTLGIFYGNVGHTEKKLKSFGSYNADFKKYKELMLACISEHRKL